MTNQDTGKFRTNTKDQYYTAPAIAATCVARILEVLPVATGYRWIEPAAGAGAFLDAAVGQTPTGFDIDPRDPRVQPADFLKWNPPLSSNSNTPILIFGNPPFGRQSATAKAFIRHAATFAAAIAFILPRSFEKPSMTNAFPPHFHCLHSTPLPTNSFTVNGEPYDVPCVFQVWERREVERPQAAPIPAVGFTYVKATEIADLIVRRVGVYAGAAYLPSVAEQRSPQSHYFIRLDPAYRGHTAKILECLKIHTFPTNTTGPRSISKPEVNVVLNSILTTVVTGDHLE
jgi:hypothetical protein